jgi:hypothetical protein
VARWRPAHRSLEVLEYSDTRGDAGMLESERLVAGVDALELARTIWRRVFSLLVKERKYAVLTALENVTRIARLADTHKTFVVATVLCVPEHYHGGCVCNSHVSVGW